MANFTEVDVTEIPEGAFLLDVREDDEWEAGHAPDATHVALSLLGPNLAKYPTDGQLIACICKGGVRSAKAAEHLGSHGYNVVNVRGGMLAWERAGLPMVSENDSPPEVI